MKMVNHSRLTKIGFFVGANGFTSEIGGELKRAGRSDYHIVLLDGKDLEEFMSSPVDLFTWLEGKTVKFY